MATEVYRGPLGPKHLDSSRGKIGTPYTPPDPEHYAGQYLLDSGAHTIIYARHGQPHKGVQELESLFNWQNKETGFIPNTVYHPTIGTNHLERRLIFGKDSQTSHYSQPPILTVASWEIFEAFVHQGKEQEGEDFFKRNYETLRASNTYLTNERKNDGKSSLIKITHPHETGRDNDPTFDFLKNWRLSQERQLPPFLNNIRAKINGATNLIDLYTLGRSQEKKGWPTLPINDVMFNCLYAESLRYMGEIAHVVGKSEDELMFSVEAHSVGQEIVDTMWNPKESTFYALRTDTGQQIDVKSISGLFPVVLPEITDIQLSAIVDSAEDSNEYGPPVFFPTVPRSSKYYDPSYKEWGCVWRGPFTHLPWYLVKEGLLMQLTNVSHRLPALARRIERVVEHSEEVASNLVRRYGPREGYNSLTGEPVRNDARSFGWANLGVTPRRKEVLSKNRSEVTPI